MFSINSYKGKFVSELQHLYLRRWSCMRLVRKRNCFRGSTDEFIWKCHWLPVKQRIVFKLCLMVQKYLNGTAPPCLSDMLMHVYSERTKKLEQYQQRYVWKQMLCASGSKSLELATNEDTRRTRRWEVQEVVEDIPLWWLSKFRTET